MIKGKGWEQKFILIILALVLTVSTVALTACGGDDDDTPTPTPPPKTTVAPPPTPIAPPPKTTVAPPPTTVAPPPKTTVAPPPTTVAPPPPATTGPAAPPLPAGWTKAQRAGTNAAFYHPSEWIIMLDQAAPLLIIALDPTFFPNGAVAKFEVAADTKVEDFAATFVATKLGAALGFTNVKPMTGGTMTLATGVTSPYVMFTGDKSGYNMQGKGVFVKDGTAIYYMQCANFPFMWDDTLKMVDQILGSFHIVK